MLLVSWYLFFSFLSILLNIFGIVILGDLFSMWEMQFEKTQVKLKYSK